MFIINKAILTSWVLFCSGAAWDTQLLMFYCLLQKSTWVPSAAGSLCVCMHVPVCVRACTQELKTCRTHFTWRLYPGCLSFTQSSFKTDGIGPYDSLSPSKLRVHNTVSLWLSCLSKLFLRTALSVPGWAVHPTRFFCLSRFEAKYEEKPPVFSSNCL